MRQLAPRVPLGLGYDVAVLQTSLFWSMDTTCIEKILENCKTNFSCEIARQQKITWQHLDC